MAKGKYAARAVNRAASIDNDVIVQLRRDLSNASTERDRALADLAVLRSSMNSRLLAASDAALADERARIAQDRSDLLEDIDELHRDAAREITAIMMEVVRTLRHQLGDEGGFPSSLLEDSNSKFPSITRLYALLGVKDSAGNLLEQICDAGEVFKGEGHRRTRARRSLSRMEGNLRQNRNLHNRSREALLYELKKAASS